MIILLNQFIFLVIWILFVGIFSDSINGVFASSETVQVPVGSSIPGCEQVNECYIPFEININVGDTITWNNDDTAVHTVTSGVDARQRYDKALRDYIISGGNGIADLERQNPLFKETVKITITPLITSLSILNHVDIDSEAEVLGYGISLIMLNVGMYFVVPAIFVIKIRIKLAHNYQ